MVTGGLGSGQKKLIVFGVLCMIATVAFFACVRWVKVQGHERVIWQQISGVSDTIAEDGLHFYFGLTTTPYTYDISSETFIVDDKTINPKNTYMGEKELQQNQPDSAPVEIPVQMDRLTPEDLAAGKTTGPTPVLVSCVMQYHLDPTKLVALHKQKTKAYRTTFIKDVLLELIISKTTVLDARTVYQGAGRVRLQQTIEAALKAESRFKKYGIAVEKFIIREIVLRDKEFLMKIKAEALAEQTRKTAEKEQIAFRAEAEAARAKALSEQNRRLVEAATKKGEEIANAEAQKAKIVLAAQAEKERMVLAAEAQRERDRLEGEGLQLRKIAEAKGVLALGKAEAEAKRLKLIAYEGEGGRRFAEVEKARALGIGIEKIYYIPSSMSINTIAKDFKEATTIALPTQGPKKK